MIEFELKSQSFSTTTRCTVTKLFDAKGMEGHVVKVLTDFKGRPISPNFPIQVEFEVEGAKRPFKAHLKQDELEPLG